MPPSRRALGDFGEKYVQAHLARTGYCLVACNVRLPAGEIDIIAREGETLVFLEVRTRRGRSFGLPEESITMKKSATLRRLAYQYLQGQALPSPDWRIDVVAVEIDSAGRVSRLEVFKNAIPDLA